MKWLAPLLPRTLNLNPTFMAPKLQPKKKAASKLGVSLGLSFDEETEIREAWEMFADEAASEEAGEEAITTGDVAKILQALGCESDLVEMQEIIETVDPDDVGYVVWERLLEVAALKIRTRDNQEEVEKAYHLFTGGTEGPITFESLKRIAAELKEEVSDEQIKDMLAEACRDPKKGVDMNDFDGVMKKAGVL